MLYHLDQLSKQVLRVLFFDLKLLDQSIFRFYFQGKVGDQASFLRMVVDFQMLNLPQVRLFDARYLSLELAQLVLDFARLRLLLGVLDFDEVFVPLHLLDQRFSDLDLLPQRLDLRAFFLALLLQLDILVL